MLGPDPWCLAVGRAWCARVSRPDRRVDSRTATGRTRRFTRRWQDRSRAQPVGDRL